MLQQKEPDDYVVATGETHSVREFVELSFRLIGIEVMWEGHGVNERGIDRKTGKVLVEVSREFFRPAEVNILVGDYGKARERLGWEPRTSFDDLVRIMVEADLRRLERADRK
jgi:GDPmannose 4,6-dehydratase